MKPFPQNPVPALFLVLAVLAGPVRAQEAKATPGETPLNSTYDAALTALDGQIDRLSEEINGLSDIRSDTGLEYNHMEDTYLEDLMKDRADEAQKAGDAPKSAGILKEIQALHDQKDSELAQDLVLLDKRNQLSQLRYDRLLELYKKMEEKIRETGNEIRLKEVEETRNFIGQLKDIENQELDLNKRLLLARQKYDYKAADGLRAQLKDLRTKTKDIREKSADQLKRLEGTIDMGEQGL